MYYLYCKTSFITLCKKKWRESLENLSPRVAGSDLQKRGRSHPDPDRRGSWPKKNFFRRFGPQFGAKLRKGRAPWAPSLDPPQAPCKVIKDTLGFWIPRSKVDSGFQEYWIPNYLSVELGFQIFIVTVTDSWFPSVKKGFQSLWFRDCTSRSDRIPFFFQRLPFLCSSLSFCFDCVSASSSFHFFFLDARTDAIQLLLYFSPLSPRPFTRFEKISVIRLSLCLSYFSWLP